MKRHFMLLAAMILVCAALAQSPQKISFQAVIRNNNGQLLANQNIGLRLSILQGSGTGSIVYSETHNLITNANGLVTCEIGEGTVVSGTFGLIDWSSGPYYIKTETDLTGGSNYSVTGTSQVLSVPYALYAIKSADAFSGEYIDLKNKPLNLDEDQTNDVLISGDQTISGYKTFSGTINASNNQIKGVASPIESTDAANKAYVDRLAQKVADLEAFVDDKYGLIEDNEGNKYKTIKIGEQVWMSENLKAEFDRDGAHSVFSFAPAFDTNTISEYGRLYNCWAITDKICPIGWRLPTDADWKTLEQYIGMDESSLDSIGCDRGINEAVNLKVYGNTGFNAIFPGGAMQSGGSIPGHGGFGSYATFLCYGSIPISGKFPTGIVFRKISIYNDRICRETEPEDSRLTYYGSIRCLKE